MNFDREIILSKIDPTLIQTSLTDHELVRYSQEKYRTHNHYVLTDKFMSTNFYKHFYDKVPNRTLFEIRDEIIELHSKVDKSKPLEIEFLTDLLTLLVEHIKMGSYTFRFGVGHWIVGMTEITLNKLEEGIRICDILNQYKNDPETNGFTTPGWNSAILSSMWASLYAGLVDEGMYIANTIEDFLNKLVKNPSSNQVFPEMQMSHFGRQTLSLHMVKAQLHLLSNEPKKAKESFEKIVQFHHEKGNDPHSKVWWLAGLTRLTEAAIEVYKLDPTEENKQRAIDYYVDSIKTEWLEHTETVRERLLITYMLFEEVLKIKVA